MSDADRTDPHKPVIVLFRNDLRVADNRALSAAAASGKPVVCVFILDVEETGARRLGAAWKWWLHHSLADLADTLKQHGCSLVLRKGEVAETVARLVDETGADTVLWNRRYDPPASAADAAMKTALRKEGIAAESFDGELLHEPSRLRTGAGGPYRVYSAFWRAFCSDEEPRHPLPPPRELNVHGRKLKSDRLADWHLLPGKPDWAGGLRDEWTPGEKGAAARLEAFVDEGLDGYAEGREIPGREQTSRLSPHLSHGEITPYQIWHAVRARRSKDAERFRMEIVWREFCYHLLVQAPDLGSKNFNTAFDAFPWSGKPAHLNAWQKGETGYPIVDAGMRQLWRTGWMHNRMRMVVASFLIKHLLVDWREGERWFWDALVDADPASNTANWQWVAGSGADAAPYFRIFNPILQGRKFDPDGRYVREFVPELAKLPDRFVHMPWKAPAEILEQAGVKLGDSYPVPLVDHDRARQRALTAYRDMRGAT